MTNFPPQRAAALQRLADFVPHAGFEYAQKRNFDLPGHSGVSRLSPYLRHRMITEEEVLRATLQHHTADQASKFIAEVCWRTYWKGVLERRPSLWDEYLIDLNNAWNMVQTNGGLRRDWEAACMGETGIDCFDHWARELAETGYLHNHARMWFASIWIFTLRLPWVLGADFFLRHLLDGDPASNTLSWRWVGGLQTKGKTYLARPENIAKFTNGAFHPTGLATDAPPLNGPDLPPVGPVPKGDLSPGKGRFGVLITAEDMSLDWVNSKPDSVAIFTRNVDISPLQTAPKVIKFKGDCLDDLAAQFNEKPHRVTSLSDITSWAATARLDQVLMAYVPVGATATHLAPLKNNLAANDVALNTQIREYDQTAWTKATHGFFRFKDVIPTLLQRLS